MRTSYCKLYNVKFGMSTEPFRLKNEICVAFVINTIDMVEIHSAGYGMQRLHAVSSSSKVDMGKRPKAHKMVWYSASRAMRIFGLALYPKP